MHCLGECPVEAVSTQEQQVCTYASIPTNVDILNPPDMSVNAQRANTPLLISLLVTVLEL